MKTQVASARSESTAQGPARLEILGVPISESPEFRPKITRFQIFQAIWLSTESFQRHKGVIRVMLPFATGHP